MALLEVIDLCYRNFDINNKVVGIYFDLQKTLDTVDHKILLHKLYNCGIRGILFEWLTNYLTNRKQYTVVNNANSSIQNIVCGVPQQGRFHHWGCWGCIPPHQLCRGFFYRLDCATIDIRPCDVPA